MFVGSFQHIPARLMSMAESVSLDTRCGGRFWRVPCLHLHALPLCKSEGAEACQLPSLYLSSSAISIMMMVLVVHTWAWHFTVLRGYASWLGCMYV